MYWLPFGAAVNTGMRLLVDDKPCLDMLDAVGSIGAVTEFIDVDMAAMSGTDLVDVVGDEAVFDLFRDENVLNLDPASTIIDAQLGDQTAEDDNILCLDAPATHEDAQNGTEDEHEDEGDTECDVTGFTSDEDDEAKEIRTNYKAYMSKRKKREGIPLDTPTSMDLPIGIVPVNNFGDGIAYFDSDEDVSQGRVIFVRNSVGMGSPRLGCLWPCLVSNFYPKFHYTKRRFTSHQNVGTCIEY
jgi:hypothetical protein